MSKKKITVTLSVCCDSPAMERDGENICVKCEKVCDTYDDVEEYYDEPDADDERGNKKNKT